MFVDLSQFSLNLKRKFRKSYDVFFGRILCGEREREREREGGGRRKKWEMMEGRRRKGGEGENRDRETR